MSTEKKWADWANGIEAEPEPAMPEFLLPRRSASVRIEAPALSTIAISNSFSALPTDDEAAAERSEDPPSSSQVPPSQAPTPEASVPPSQDPSASESPAQPEPQPA
jgi:hypothetical protein